MKKCAKLSISFFSEWQCGSGLSYGTTADSGQIRDNNNLPYVPGKTIKGMFLWAARLAGKDTTLFGDEGVKPGTVHFGSAHIVGADLIDKELIKLLYVYRTTTALGDKGVAKAKSLRTAEFVLPVELEAEILYDTDEEFSLLEELCGFIRHMGFNRHRGYGKCRFKIEKKVNQHII